MSNTPLHLPRFTLPNPLPHQPDFRALRCAHPTVPKLFAQVRQAADSKCLHLTSTTKKMFRYCSPSPSTEKQSFPLCKTCVTALPSYHYPSSSQSNSLSRTGVSQTTTTTTTTSISKDTYGQPPCEAFIPPTKPACVILEAYTTSELQDPPDRPRNHTRGNPPRGAKSRSAEGPLSFW